jgi:hypothetical protein
MGLFRAISRTFNKAENGGARLFHKAEAGTDRLFSKIDNASKVVGRGIANASRQVEVAARKTAYTLEKGALPVSMLLGPAAGAVVAAVAGASRGLQGATKKVAGGSLNTRSMILNATKDQRAAIGGAVTGAHNNILGGIADAKTRAQLAFA